MAYNYRVIDQPPPAHVQHHRSPSFSYFAEEAIRVGYLRPDFGRTYGHFQNAMDIRESLLREIEKERIREGIIAEEIDRRRILDAEPRREPMMEGEWALRRVGRLPPSGAFLMGFEPRFPPLQQQPQHSSVQEIMAIPLGERLGMGISSAGMPARQEFGHFEMVPFNERRVELSISEVPFEQQSVKPMISEMPPKNNSVKSRILELKPPSDPEQLSKELKISGVGATSEHGKEKDKLLAKPEVNLSGVKRRAEMAAEAFISNNLPTTRVPKKKIKDGWDCALCQVSVTSECVLNSHLKGRKHKSMEAALRAQGNGKSLRTGDFPKEHKLVNLDATTDDPMAEKNLKTGETASIPEDKDAPLLQIEHNADNSKNNADLVQNAQKTKELPMKKFKFWCDLCNVGAFAENVMKEHERGKKHTAMLREINANGTTGIVTQMNDKERAGKGAEKD